MNRLPFLAGLLLVLGYWVAVKPAGQGYAEDMCNHQMARQVMAENLAEYGHPVFETHHVMAPTGMNSAFLTGWNVERDWVGAYVFQWSRDFPFTWAWFGLSLVVCYAGVGFMLRQMGLSGPAAWAFAVICVLVNIPRHYKLWHHSDTVMMHWVYLGFFLDAWVWQRFVKEHRWSVALEAWRGFFMFGVLNTMGYFWGPSLIEWALVHGLMLGLVVVRWRGGKKPVVEVSRWAALPVALLVVMVPQQARWFLPLAEAAKAKGEIYQRVDWFADLWQVFRPLWFDRLAQAFDWHTSLAPLDQPETVVAAGWLYLVPVGLGLWLMLRRQGVQGALLLAPFFTVVAIGVGYLIGGPSLKAFIPAVQAVVPFMKFFRAASRWGLLLTPLWAVLVALCWPELSALGRRLFERRSPWLALYAGVAMLEVGWLSTKPNAFPPLPGHVREILDRVRQAPGDTVLTLPFCVAGGNGVCTALECVHYPDSTVGACTRMFTDKNVYGVYASRLTDDDCRKYFQQPYISWFTAWGQNRCLTDPEWDQLCAFLEQTPRLSALLVYPDIWEAAGRPECQAKFEARLGPPLDSARLFTRPTRGGGGERPAKMDWYAPHCRPQ